MYYCLLLIIIYSLCYYITENYTKSVFASLLLFSFVTIFNYNYKYLLFPITYVIICFAFNVKITTEFMKCTNFIIIFYICFSITELIVHRYIMHCNNDSILTTIFGYIPFLNKQYLLTCDKHIQHHIEVDPDMTIPNNKNKESLFMGWQIFGYLFMVIFICFTIGKYISNYNISFKYLIFFSLIIAFLWQYLWNKLHAQMHEYDIDYSIKEGPYDEGILDLTFVKNILLTNHENHHLQKGDNKGNYNVILLGADEWFGLNVKNVDNNEYCKTHTNEKICRH